MILSTFVIEHTFLPVTRMMPKHDQDRRRRLLQDMKERKLTLHCEGKERETNKGTIIDRWTDKQPGPARGLGDVLLESVLYSCRQWQLLHVVPWAHPASDQPQADIL